MGQATSGIFCLVRSEWRKRDLRVWMAVRGVSGQGVAEERAVASGRGTGQSERWVVGQSCGIRSSVRQTKGAAAAADCESDGRGD